MSSEPQDVNRAGPVLVSAGVYVTGKLRDFFNISQRGFLNRKRVLRHPANFFGENIFLRVAAHLLYYFGW